MIRVKSLCKSLGLPVERRPASLQLNCLRIPFIMGKRPDDEKANTSCHIQVLGVGSDTGCTVPSVLLFFDRKRYLFNVGEGFQRFCVEHKVKLTKVTSVISTRSTTHTLGGLPGMLLTMKDITAGGLLAGQVGFDVHGPMGMMTAANAFKTFVSFKDMGLKVKEFGSSEKVGLSQICEPVIQNESVTITPVVIQPSADGSKEPEAKKAKMENGDASSTHHDGPVSSFVCQLSDIPGKFLPQKAASLGVPRGPLYGKLQKGESVEGANGKTVHPSDVMEPSTPGPVAIVVDCPSEDYIEGLTDSSSGLSTYSKDTRGVCVYLQNISCVN